MSVEKRLRKNKTNFQKRLDKTKIKWHNNIKTMKKTVAVTERNERENVAAESILLCGDLRIPLWSRVPKIEVSIAACRR